MKVSIITVVLNGVETIEDCIKSIIRQTHQDIEYVIIDGGSTDGTIDVIKKYRDKISSWMSEPDKGIYDAMNKGIKVVTGEIIGILNSDDIYTNDSVIETVVKTINEKKVDACYGDLVYVDKPNTNKIIRYWRSCEYQEGLFSKGWVPPHPTFFVKKLVYETYGLFDLNFTLAADYEIMFRFLHKHHITTAYIPAILVKMRLGGSSNRSVSNVIKQNMEIARILNRNGLKMSPTFLYHKFINRISQFGKHS